MKKILVILGLIGWLCLPFLCHAVYVNIKADLGIKTNELIDAGKATHQELDSGPWFGPIKSLGAIAETYRSRYFLPFCGVWLLMGAGIAANMIKRMEYPTRTATGRFDKKRQESNLTPV